MADFSQLSNAEVLQTYKPGSPEFLKLSPNQQSQVLNIQNQLNIANANPISKSAPTSTPPSIGAAAPTKKKSLTDGIKSEFGYNNELDFLIGAIPALWNNDNQDTIYNDIYGININNNEAQTVKTSNLTVVYKYPKSNNTNAIKDYYKNNVYKGDSSNSSPYVKLIKDFSQKGYEAVKLSAADFAYLKDLGVYPTNRVWVLRRFKEGVIVPNNLLDWNNVKDIPKPLSTIVGWIKPEDDKLFSMSFNENWETTNIMKEYFIKLYYESPDTSALKFRVPDSTKIHSYWKWRQFANIVTVKFKKEALKGKDWVQNYRPKDKLSYIANDTSNYRLNDDFRTISESFEEDVKGFYSIKINDLANIENWKSFTYIETGHKLSKYDLQLVDQNGSPRGQRTVGWDCVYYLYVIDAIKGKVIAFFRVERNDDPSSDEESCCIRKAGFSDDRSQMWDSYNNLPRSKSVV